MKPREERTRGLQQISCGKFIRESKELLSEHDLPRPITYYVQLFRTAFEFIKTDPDRYIDELNNTYVTFSEHLLDYFEKQNSGDSSFSNKAFFVSNILDIQQDITYQGGMDAEMVDMS